MTYPDAIQFLYDLRLFGTKLGLENTFRLASLAGNPQMKLRFIHVAGTNGKGSTCAMLESIYRAAGMRVGLFTSPHLISFRERIQVNRQLINEIDVVRLVDKLRRQSGSIVSPTQETKRRAPERLEPRATMPKHPDTEIGAPTEKQDACPTFFEFVTVMALCYFAEQKCDLVIWETGMGGRLDATNIVMPLASVITNVQFDHQKWLGDTLAKIAYEKAGIIKPRVPVITATDSPEALEVISETARQQNAPLTKVEKASNLTKAVATVALPLLGEHQQWNAALALATVEALREDLPVNEEAVRIGLATVQWPGRLQLVNRPNQTLLLDGAHNVSGAEALCDSLQQLFPDKRYTLVLGVLKDKDWPRICQLLAPLSRRIVLAPVSSDRSASSQELADACRHANPAAEVIACHSLDEALQRTQSDPLVVLTGSLYLVGEAMECLDLEGLPSAAERELNEWSQVP